MEFGLAPDQSRATFDTMTEQAVMAEALGYTTVWAHEHHSNAMMYPDPLMALAAIAPATSSIRLGTSMLLLPIHHPVRVAQQSAMLDVMSGGRLSLGLANGYSATDLATFGVGSHQRGKRLSAGVQLIRDLWSGEHVTRQGMDFDLQGFELFPLPVQKPSPPIYIGGHADAALRRAANMGDNYFISTTASFHMVGELIERYRTFLDEAGKPFRGVLLNRVVCATATEREAVQAREFYSRVLLALYDSWGHSNISGLDESQRSVEAVSENNLIIGSPEQCRERILDYQALGVSHIACLTNFGSPPVEQMNRSIRLFGEQVIPYFD